MANNLIYCDQCKTELDFTTDDAKDEHMLHFDTLDELPVAPNIFFNGESYD